MNDDQGQNPGGEVGQGHQPNQLRTGVALTATLGEAGPVLSLKIAHDRQRASGTGHQHRHRRRPLTGNQQGVTALLQQSQVWVKPPTYQADYTSIIDFHHLH